MATFNFTQGNIEKADLGWHYDSNNKSKYFGVQLKLYVGKKTKSFYYSIQSENIQNKIGAYPIISLEDARLEVAKIGSEFATNRSKLAKTIKDTKDIPTLAEGVQDYITEGLDGKRSQKNMQRLFNRRIKDSWIGKQMMDDIEEGTAEDWIKELSKTKSKKGGYLKVDVNHCRQLCSVAYNYKIKRNKVLRKTHYNPFNFKNTIESTSTEKDYFLLNKDLLKKIVVHVAETQFDDSKKAVYLISLFTGQHNSEIARMKWTEINNDFWHFDNWKNTSLKDHRVYLHPIVRKIIDLYGNKDEEYIFAKSNGKLIEDMQKVNVSVNKMLQANGYVKKFNSNHHRHTLMKYMDIQGVRHFEILIGHAPNTTLMRHYVTLTDDERQEAFTSWANYILGVQYNDILEGKNITRKQLKFTKKKIQDSGDYKVIGAEFISND